MILTLSAFSLYDAFVTLLFPKPCVLCQRSVERQALGPVCEDCWAKTRLISSADPVCWKCGTPSYAALDPAKRESVRCGRCDLMDFTAARACGFYENALRESVLALKSQPKLPGHVGDLLIAAASARPFNRSTLIIPVPLHVERQKVRGFNQALVIAQAISKSLGLPINDVSLVRTSQANKYRAGLDVKGRTETVARAFQVTHPALVKGERIMLVDDVFTTGATAAACASALVSAGAQDVYVLTIARTVRY